MSVRVRAIFLSDLHLGTRACQAERLLEFLREYESEYLFLLGDIVDFWAMRRRGVYWSAAQNTFVQKVLKRARHDVKVVFVPGNHDEAAREHCGTSFGNIQVENDYVHTAADGRRYLLLHGDEFDGVTRYHRWLAILGDHAYAFAVRLNILLSLARRTLGIAGYWSLSGYAKRRIKRAVSFIYDFEESVVRHAKERGVDGVVCGHIHAASLREIEGTTYVNCGDWVDSCTAVVEHVDGRLELVQWLGAAVNPAEPQRDAGADACAPESPAAPANTRLPLLLLAAMKHTPVGVMVARGDLGVEVGFERLWEVQEEILWLCEAAHVPVIWATQVLESLAKGGMPSRAEVTDAAMGSRAECVMLNKGTYIVETLGFLCNVLGRMQAHQEKKTATLRKLSISEPGREPGGRRSDTAAGR